MRIAVVVLHYHNLADTLECLDSLQSQNYDNYEVILVDNGSHDPHLESALGNYSLLTLIRNEDNQGFAEGNNVGIRAAMKRGAEGILLLNNDTTASPDLLAVFSQAAIATPKAAAFGAKIFFYDDPTLIWHAGGNVNLHTMRCYHEGCPDSDLKKKWDKVRDISYACGCALFIKKEAIEKVGLMAPEFFLLWEEIDWCWRIRQAGYRCLFIPEAKVWHKISRSFEGGNRGPLWQYYFFRNRLLFMKRNIPLAKRLRFYFTYFPKELKQILFTLFDPACSKQFKKLNLYALRGIRDHFLKAWFKLR
jgi:GT2 family glycosyltransferase